MDSLFIKSWLLFVGFLVLVVVAGIRMTAPKEDHSTVLKSSGAPIENPMITISSGEFILGSEDGGLDERPAHPVFLSAYAISQFEITQSQYQEFVKITGHRSALSRYVKNIERFNDMNQPVVYVSWLDAEKFCGWRGERLPTEAEWEKAAKGGRPQSWPWGNAPDSLYGNFLGGEDGSAYASFVGSFQKNKSEYGIYDMAGNAQEWVADWYDDYYYKTGPSRDPTGPDRGEQKVLRGGSWNDSHLAGRTTTRTRMFPDYRDTTTGFRCAKSGEP
jgi:formylglycine-generating enzyme required for sulfatase activity